MPNWMINLFRLTRREYFADFFITPPITMFYAYWSLTHSWGLLWMPTFFAGWFLWTLYEYSLHRFGLHEMPWLKDMHRLHHANQKDYIAVHPVVTVITYVLFWLLFGLRSSALMVGFSTGYIVYAVLHTAYHHAYIVGHDLPPHPRLAFLAAGKARHVAHHRYHNVCYGVTWSLWDRLFNSEKPAV